MSVHPDDLRTAYDALGCNLLACQAKLVSMTGSCYSWHALPDDEILRGGYARLCDLAAETRRVAGDLAAMSVAVESELVRRSC